MSPKEMGKRTKAVNFVARAKPKLEPASIKNDLEGGVLKAFHKK